MRRLLAVVLPWAALTVGLAAQSKPALTRGDYGQFEALSTAAPRGGFSPDGRWIVYAITRSNRNNELRIVRVADRKTTVAAFGGQPVFSSDSKWIAYSLGYSEDEQERLRTANKPIENKLGLTSLATGNESTIDAVESFAFSADGGYLAFRKYKPIAAGSTGSPGASTSSGPAGAGRGGAAATEPEQPVGNTLIVRQLATGTDTTFGNVAEFAWQDSPRGHLLALAISADGKVGNGVQLFDPETTILKVLDSSEASYTNLAWRKDAGDLAVLRAKIDPAHEGATEHVLCWTGLPTASSSSRVFDPTANPALPKGMRTVAFRRPSWSEDGKTLFVGVAKWDEKPAAVAGRGAGGRGANATVEAAVPSETGTEPKVDAPAKDKAVAGTDPPKDEPAVVDIWHWNDPVVMARQKLSAAADRRRNLLAAWHLDTNTFVVLGGDLTNEQVTPIRKTTLAFVADWSKYAMDRSIGRPAADLYVEDTVSGTRTKLKDHVNDRYAQVSPGGTYALFLQDDHYWTINLATRAVINITKVAATSFVDKESDETIKQKPPFGVAGWAKDDAAVLLYDKFDIWQVAPDGSAARRLTNGAPEQVRHRLVRLDPEETTIDLKAPLYVALFGVASKKSGYGVMKDGAAVDRAVWLAKSVTSLAKAKDADVYAYLAQDYDDSPDLFVGPDLKTAKQITSTNAFQDKFAWGRSELIEYKTDKGLALQGTLYYPAGYDPARKYPMVVYLYERLSDNVHRYVAPSDREYYNTTVFSSQGYFVLQPDIAFRPRQPGISVVECVTAAVKKTAATGVIDPKRVGVVGHSWGGFDAAFLATHTTGVFAAAVAGAPITDLVSNYGNHHWSSGIAETDHIETGQQRMEVPLYEDLNDYVANSAVFTAHTMTVPLLIEVGDSDGTVFWHQGVELYNIARRAKKNVVMLVYNGEDHGLRQKKNQIDYQQRILAWFGHYLKDQPALAWITDGETFLDREAEVKKISVKR